MLSTPSRSTDLRAAETSAPWACGFQGEGMYFEAMTTRGRTAGSRARSRPRMRSLSPFP